MASATRRAFVLGAAAAPLLARGTMAQAAFPVASAAHRHRLSARRRHRHPRPPDGAENVGALRPAGRGREPARRERPDRHPGRGAIGARRPHHLLRHHRQPRGQSGALSRPLRPRHRARSRAAVACRLARLRGGGQSIRAGEVAEGADRPRQGQARPDAVRVERQRRPAASVGRAVEPAGRASRSGTCPIAAARRRSPI